MSIYLDASILVALFSDDPFSSQADRGLRDREAVSVVSDFAAAEFASVISRKVRTREMTRQEARSVFADFDGWAARMTLRVETLPADIRTAEGALRRLDLTLRAPDAVNIAIVQRIGAELATFDRRMAECARALTVAVAKI